MSWELIGKKGGGKAKRVKYVSRREGKKKTNEEGKERG